MTSWYATIYMFTRKFRQRHPVLGYLLQLSLNVSLVLQLLGIAFTYYVYTYVVCIRMLENHVQVCIYLAVYNSIIFMMLWSLFQVIRTPVAQIPQQFKVDNTFDQRIKEVTPCESDRYFPDKSTQEQIWAQHSLISEIVQQKKLVLLEIDHFGRYRYCYQCSQFKPDRSHHCNSCGFCVLKYDHHCPWLNKCVSYSNYKFFVLYIFYACIAIIWSFLTSLEAFVRYFVRHRWAAELDEFIQVTICLILYAIVGYYPVGDLLIYHIQLIYTNETTCEQAKQPIIRSGDNRADYDIGPYRNFRAVFGWGLWMFPVDTSIFKELGLKEWSGVLVKRCCPGETRFSIEGNRSFYLSLCHRNYRYHDYFFLSKSVKIARTDQTQRTETGTVLETPIIYDDDAGLGTKRIKRLIPKISNLSYNKEIVDNVHTETYDVL